VLEPGVLLPQVAQGALAVEARADDETTITALRAIDDAVAHRAVDAERAFLAELGGGCDLPCGALARIEGDTVVLDALLASVDGRVVVRAHHEGADGLAIGAAAAREVRDAFPDEVAS
jgi:hydroxymethylbilane synthase